MNPWIVYTLGVFTPAALLFIYVVFVIFFDKRDRKRYIRAVHIFTADWNSMSPAAKAVFYRSRSEFDRPTQSERDRYIAQRWNRGFNGVA